MYWSDQPREGIFELLNSSFSSAFFYRLGNAGFDVVFQHDLTDLIESRLHCSDLKQNCWAVLVLLHHLGDAVDVTLSPRETFDDVFTFLMDTQKLSPPIGGE